MGEGGTISHLAFVGLDLSFQPFSITHLLFPLARQELYFPSARRCARPQRLTPLARPGLPIPFYYVSKCLILSQRPAPDSQVVALRPSPHRAPPYTGGWSQRTRSRSTRSTGNVSCSVIIWVQAAAIQTAVCPVRFACRQHLLARCNAGTRCHHSGKK